MHTQTRPFLSHFGIILGHIWKCFMFISRAHWRYSTTY